MNVQVVQASSVTPSNKNAKRSEPSESFSEILSKSITSEKDDISETEDIKNESLDLDDEESNGEEVNPLAVYFNLNFSQIKEDISNVMDNSTSGKVNKVNSMEISSTIPEIVTAGNMIIAEENLILDQGNMPLTEDNILLTKENSIQVEKITMPEIPKAAMGDESTDIDLKENLTTNKDISINEKFSLNKQVESLIIKENLIVEENTKVKVVNEKETTDLQEVDTSKLDKEFTNTSMKEITRTEFQTKIEPTKPVLSTENIQRVNDSIIEMMETTSEGNASIMKVKLNPEELGAVSITLKMENGKLIAKILVDNDYVKQLFSNKVNELNESLVKQKIYIEKVDIGINSKSDLHPSFNSNTNANSNPDSRRNNANYYRKNQFMDTNKKLIHGISSEHINLGSGTISILA